MLIDRRGLVIGLALGCSCLVATNALAQAAPWPRKPIRYIVPFAPGGTTDIVARVVGETLGVALGQTIVVENKAGQGGSVGAAELARAAPDGYTIGGGTISSHAINATLYDKLTYVPVKSFEPIILYATQPDVSTMAESGLAGYELSSWQAAFSPAGRPKPIIDRLYTEIDKILKTPEVAKRLGDMGLDISGMPPSELGKLVASDVPRLGKVVKDSGANAN